ncbi:MAG: class I SAM-dependent methyltransferase [Bacteroidales bacterium]|jgi:SAM-dependent methyltransferase|nr:class I SAM-dependent methyltransferase [Bacteroidales bacterium]
MKDVWNSRYSEPKFIYGTEPNNYLKDFIEHSVKGNILLPADGEGRNSVFAAKKGWQVDAFDYSVSAQIKAYQLAQINNVLINYTVSDILEFTPNKSYDLIALIYLHLIPEVRSPFFIKLSQWLKPGGHILLEAFSKNQLKNSSGGPKDINLLYDLAEINNDFHDLKIKEICETEIMLDEGKLHQGNANVIRLIAQKI